MEEFIGSINTGWGVVAVAVFSAYKIIDYLIKNSHKRREEYALKSNFKELSDKLDDHIEIDARFGHDTSMQVKRLELMMMMHQFPTKFSRIESLYKEYKSIGGNSYIDDVFIEWSDEYGAENRKKSKRKK